MLGPVRYPCRVGYAVLCSPGEMSLWVACVVLKITHAGVACSVLQDGLVSQPVLYSRGPNGGVADIALERYPYGVGCFGDTHVGYFALFVRAPGEVACAA